jgi:hypothetical protein
MKNLLALFVIVLVTVAGCSSSPPPKKAAAEVKPTSKNDPRRVGLEQIRQASDAARYWEGLQHLNADIQDNPTTRERLTPRPDTRKFLQADAALSEDELQEVESPIYRRADAHYLAECFLLRDAVHSLEVSGMPPEELASQVLAWIERHLLLHEQGDDWLPPAPLVERGYGGLRDHARVFLAMLRQIPIQACAIILPNAPDDVVLVGALTAARDRVYLFDPRRGCAVRTPEGRIATLKDAQQDPKLLAATGLDPKQLASAQVRVACPLNAMPLRMKDLETMLQVQDRIVLYQNAQAVVQDFAKVTGMPVHVWNSAASGDNIPNSPTRALRLFLPPDEGGIDKTGRRLNFEVSLVPRTTVVHALEELHLGKGQLPDVARGHLLRLIDEMRLRYDIQPHEMLLHGKGEDAIRRIGRAQLFFDAENLDNLAASDLQQPVGKWRQDLTVAYAKMANHDPDGQSAVNSFWTRDEFLLAVLNTEGEDRLNNPAVGAQERARPPQKTVTTSIVAYAVRDHLKQRALWLRAMVWQDKAEREQARADRIADKAKREARQQALHGIWDNTRVAWNQIKDRASVSPDSRRNRLEAIRALLKRGDAPSTADAAQMLAKLHLDLHQHYAANIHYANAEGHVNGPRAALAILRGIDAELAALAAKDSPGHADMTAVSETIARMRAASVNPALIHSVELLNSDWAPEGNYYWIRQRIARHIARWEKS